MKALTIIIAITVGVAFGLFNGIKKEKPIYWKLIVIAWMIIAILMNLLPPVAGNYYDLMNYTTSDDPTMMVLIETDNPNENHYIEANNEWHIMARDQQLGQSKQIIIPGKSLPLEFKQKNKIIAELEYKGTLDSFIYHSTISVNPVMVYPYIPGLGEKVRLINIHVPVAWVAVLAYLLAMFYSIRYLRTSDLDNDIKASSSAFLGTVFAILATVTGMVWAKANWGSYWNWDPRETSIFILLLIYFAYFALRNALTKKEVRARLSSVYAIIAFFTVPFFVFIMPRISEGLHPGSGSEDDLGPVMGGGSMLDSDLLATFGVSFAAFTLLFFWLLNLNFRSKKLELKINRRNINDE
mgnify:CR=1 FL=1